LVSEAIGAICNEQDRTRRLSGGLEDALKGRLADWGRLFLREEPRTLRRPWGPVVKGSSRVCSHAPMGPLPQTER
jgi:hypothetical protein